MKIKNATIKDFDTAYEYIKKLWDYNTYDYETTKEVYEKVLQDENSFAFLQQKMMELFMDSAMEIIFRPSGCQGLPAMYQV